MVGRSGVVRIDAGGGRGTGFFIRGSGLVTALHVVAGVVDDRPRWFESIALRFVIDGVPQDTEWLDMIDDLVLDYDVAEDWVVLNVETPRGLQPWDAAQAHQVGLRWRTYGFPSEDGLSTGGEVRTIDAPRSALLKGERVMVAALQLMSEEAAAGQGQPVPGFSGAPVVVAGQVVGLLRQAPHDEAGVATGGILFACPIERVVNRIRIRRGDPGLGPPRWATGESKGIGSVATDITTRHLAIIEAYKRLHDEFHDIEFHCLRPLLATPTSKQFRAVLRNFRNAEAEIRGQIAGSGHLIDKALVLMIAEETKSALGLLDASNEVIQNHDDPEFVLEQIGKVIEQLQRLIGRYLVRLEAKLSDANKSLREDPRLDGVEPVEQLRRDLEARVDEHFWLQQIDLELRATVASFQHWTAIKLLFVQIKPVSKDLREAWKDIEKDIGNIDEMLAHESPSPDKKVAEALENFSQTMAGIFRTVDADLKRLLGGLVATLDGRVEVSK